LLDEEYESEFVARELMRFGIGAHLYDAGRSAGTPFRTDTSFERKCWKASRERQRLTPP
jgi:hypothetical protein